MKSKKTKIANKLESLKEADNPSFAEDQSLLDQDINFGNEDYTSTEASEGGLADFGANEMTEEAQSTRVYRSSESSQDDDGTAVIPELNSVSTHLTNTGSENTHREITSGRASGRSESERVSYGDVYESDSHGDGSVEGLLKQAEHLRLAQEKINSLEGEIDELRRENDELLTSASTYRVLSEGSDEKIENLKSEMLHYRETLSQEIKILKESLGDRDRQLAALKQTNADLKSKVETNFKQIRKRERDLEYRLELAKVEEATLLKTKDKTILDLRRRMDKIEQEKVNLDKKNKEHYQKLQSQQQTVRGVVRALRIALTRLEGDFGVDFEVLKKAE